MSEAAPRERPRRLLRRILALVLLAGAVSAAAGGLLIDDFENGRSPRWEEKSFEGHTTYEVVPEDGGHALRATSRAAASGLVYEVELDPEETPILTWRWKVENVLEKGDARVKEGDDYAARVYVVFPHWFPPKTRTLNYIWANRMPVGTHLPNPFLERAQMIAVESGPAKTGQWITERRNIVADFQWVFGEAPPKIGAVAIMTDTDQTGESATAYYDDLRFEK